MPVKKKLSEKSDKRRRARVRVGYDADHKPIYKYAQGKTVAELERNKAALVRRYANGEQDAAEITVGEYAIEWFQTHVEPTASAGTIEMYRIALNAHILPTLGDRFIGTVRPPELQAFLNTYAGKSYSQVNKVRLTLRRIFKQAMADYIIDRDPTVTLKAPTTTQGSGRQLTAEETEAILRVGFADPEGLLMLVLYYLGLRPGEALGLQWGDIDFKDHTVHIQRDIDFKDGGKVGALKTKSSDRRIPVPQPLYDVLATRRGIGFIFRMRNGETVSRSSYIKLWKRLMAKTGTPDVIAYYFRHNYASLLYAAEVPALQAKEWMGHSSIVTTLKIYTHLEEEFKGKNTQNLLDFFNLLPDGCQVKK